MLKLTVGRVCLVPAVINHMVLCRAKGTLVVPKWSLFHFWHLLVEWNGQFLSFAVEHYEYVKPIIFVLAGSDSKHFS